jgi:hypothetical protein
LTAAEFPDAAQPVYLLFYRHCVSAAFFLKDSCGIPLAKKLKVIYN